MELRDLTLWNTSLSVGSLLPSQLRVAAGNKLKLTRVVVELKSCWEVNALRKEFCDLEGGPPTWVQVSCCYSW